MENSKIYYNFLYAVVFVFPFLFGGYYVFSCTALSVALAVGLLVLLWNKKQLVISKSFPTIVFLAVTILYFISRFWAIDKSMAFEGALKYLCLFLFIVSLWQIDEEDRENLFGAIPISATVMTVGSALLGLIPQLHSRFYDAIGDLNGTFEYANAYAIFLLIAIVVLIFNHKSKLLSVGCAIVCCYGIYASNSRAVWLLSVFVLLSLAIYFAFVKLGDKKNRIIFIASIVTIIIVVSVVLWKFGYIDKLLNYLNTDGSLNERYLYYKDCFLYSLKHPFGKGAYAFYYGQPQFQSAYYYAIDVHCDYLQLMIEIGIVPAVLFVVMLITQLFSKNNSLLKKFVLLIIAMHSAVDYDLQFLSIFFILILTLDFKNSKSIKINSKLVVTSVSAVVIIINALVGVSNFCNYIGKHDKSVYFYKNTPSMLVLMHSTNQQQIGYDYATDILSINDSIFEANNVLANIYAENDRYDEAISQMELVIKKDPRTMQHYKNYIDLCIAAMDYYEKEGENSKVQACREKISSVSKRIDELKENTDKRGIKYGRKQDFDVGEKYIKIIETIN